MKKPIALLLCLGLLLALTACADGEGTAADGTTSTTTTTTAATSDTTTTTASTTTTTTTTATTTTTVAAAAIEGNVWTYAGLEDGVVSVFSFDFRTDTVTARYCIPWDEAFTEDNWKLVKSEEPESVYVFEGGEYYVDAAEAIDFTADVSADGATVSYERNGATQRVKLERSGNFTLEVAEDSEDYRLGLTLTCE